MSLERCTKKNPLVRDGISQNQRYGKALDPTYFLVDERDTADLIEFCRKYARRLEYYDLNNSRQGNWTAFIENSIVSVTSKVFKRSYKSIDDDYRVLEENLLGPTLEPVDNPTGDNYHILLEAIRANIEEIYLWRQSAYGYELETDLINVLKQKLEPALKLLIAYQKGADSDSDIAAETLGNFYVTANYEFLDFSSIVSNLDDPLYFVADDVSANLEIYVDPSSPDSEGGKIRNAMTTINNLHAVVLDVVKELNVIGANNLELVLENYDDHQPHIALLMGFIQMFKQAQGSLNEFTKRHLDFFYRDVLQIDERSAIADKVQLVFELAQSLTNYVLPAGTIFDAGEDDTGVPIQFELTKDTVLSNANVVSLKTVFVEKDPLNNVINIYKAPVANSASGDGEQFSGNESWPMFGTNSSSKMVSNAELGFAVASKHLLLKEGDRTITLNLNLEDGSFIPSGIDEFDDLNNLFVVSITGETGWISITQPLITYDAGNALFSMVLDIPQNEEPIVGYDSTIHGFSFSTENPVMRITLAQNNNTVIGYDLLKNAIVAVSNEAGEIIVNATDYRDLILQNDDGVLPVGEPIHPMTFSPRKGSKFYIGSREVFSKNLDSVTIRYSYSNYPDEGIVNYYDGYRDNIQPNQGGGNITSSDVIIDNADVFKWNISYLRDKVWSPLITQTGQVQQRSKPLFSTLPDFELVINPSRNKDEIVPRNENLPEFESFNELPVQGGIRLDFDPTTSPGFMVDKYPTMLSRAILKNSDKLPIPNPPYIPEIEDVRIDFTATDVIDLTTGSDKIFILEPFGYKEASKDVRLNEDLNLLPDFAYKQATSTSSSIENEGTLYIGIEELVPPQIFSLYVQVAEGTDNPDLELSDVKWSYLVGNVWKEFEKEAILQDTTNGLIKTGVVEFSLPVDMSKAGTTILDGSLNWIRVEVNENTKAFNQAIRIRSRGAEAVYVDSGNSPDRLRNAVPKETITETLNANPNLDEVIQYTASTGGRIAEQDQEYYTRVSERLMHKNKSVTVRDYETQVLEEFPDIFRVKCVNHSNLLSEIAPGYVTVVAIPYPNEEFESNPFELKLPQSRLKEIRDLLEPNVNLFLKDNLKVANPLYEKVRFRFGVEFNLGADRRASEVKLIEDMKKFISPWAFGNLDAITFGNTVDRSVVLNFIEELSYVDYVTDFEMYHLKPDNNFDSTDDVSSATASTAISILVTDQTHILELPNYTEALTV